MTSNVSSWGACMQHELPLWRWVMIVVPQVWAQGRPLQVSSVFYVLALLNLPQLVSHSNQANAASA